MMSLPTFTYIGGPNMKRTIVALAALLALVTMTVARPIAAPRGAGSAVFHLVETTVAEIHKALQTRLMTSEQLVEMYLARIAAYDDAGPAVS
jgi:amidase